MIASRARVLSLLAGVAVAVGATIGPLHAAAEQRFSWHMIQHQLLLLVAAPLIVAGRPLVVMSRALPRRIRRAGFALGRARILATPVRWFMNPLAVLLGYAAVLWLWHLPGPYQAAVRNDGVHALEHITFLLGAGAFWSVVLRPFHRRRSGYAPALLVAAGTMMLGGWLGAVLTFGRVAYPLYAVREIAVGVDPATDQQLAGMLMWIPTSIVLFGVSGALLVSLLRSLDARFPHTVERT